MAVSKSDLADLQKLALEIERAQFYHKELEDSLDESKKYLRRLQEEDMPAKFAEIGLASVKLENGDEISIKQIYRGHISKAKQEEAFGWLRNNGHGDLIKNELKVAFGKGDDAQALKTRKFLEEGGYSYTDKESVHPQSLGAFIKEQTEKGQALPHDLLGVYIGETTKIKRGK